LASRASCSDSFPRALRAATAEGSNVNGVEVALVFVGGGRGRLVAGMRATEAPGSLEFEAEELKARPE
jgi:hypothetical protein